MDVAVPAGARDLTLEDVRLPLGPGSLEVLCEDRAGEAEPGGAYQVIVTRS